MRIGKFGVSDTDDSRYAIGFNEKEFDEYVLNCGDCFEIKINNKWIGVRIKMDENGWYFLDEDGNKRDIPYNSAHAKI